MAASEKRLIALTYISARVDVDEFQIKAIEEELTPAELIEELSGIAVVLASTLGLLMDKDDPKKIEDVIKILRRIEHAK